MITATAHSITSGQTRIDQLAYGRARGALDTAIATTRKMTVDAAAHVTDDAAISQLADKPLNALVAVIKEAITKQQIHPADPVAAEMFIAEYKSKDKVELRRSILLTWFTSEKKAHDDVLAKLEAAKKKAEKKAAKQAPVVTVEHADGSATSTTADKVSTVVVPPPAKRTVADIAAAIARGELDPASSETQQLLAEAAKPARAKREKKAKEPKPEKQPRDKYDGMTLDQLLLEVHRMFGHGTEMTNESALRYKLRRGEKQIKAGQKASFSVSTPAAPRVKFTVERAKQLRELLVILEKKGNGVAGQIIGEIDDQLTPKSDTTTQVAA